MGLRDGPLGGDVQGVRSASGAGVARPLSGLSLMRWQGPSAAVLGRGTVGGHSLPPSCGKHFQGPPSHECGRDSGHRPR